ncbi:MAG: alpha-2-macroglobulin family protein, partial [Rickettsiales bacterium]|nr:alpha-2-macroglobulin family protein [Rickettsiales bacterium]
IKSWGITDKGIYKKGESVKYKIYVKEQNNTNFVLAKKEKYSIEVINPQEEIIYKKEDLILSEFGSINGEFKLDESAISGHYQFKVYSNYTSLTWYPLKFLVADFKVPTFKVETTINKNEYISGDNIDIETTANLYSGGAYTDASTRIITKIKSVNFNSDNYLAKGFRFDSCGFYEDYQCDKVLSSEYLKLNEKGTANNKININEDLIYCGRINFESSVSDDTGKNISSFASADYFAVDRFVGLKTTKWVYKEKENVDVEYLVADKKGSPVKNSEVDINIQYYDTKVAKVKSAGNTFVGDYTSEWIDYAKCNGKTSDKKANTCTFKPEKAGRYRLIASVKDSKNNIQKTVETIWVSGSSWVTWTNSNDDVLEIIPSAEKYNVGDTAEYMVMNPYPNSYALITIERFGVIKQWVQKFDNNTPMIKFKIEPDYVPGFYLSVKIISKRVDKPIDANNVDLGKPAFKIGYKKVLVDDPYKKIDINIDTDKSNYKPGETVKVKITSKNKLRNDEKTEVAVIVLDEGIFDMIQDKEKYFDIYKGFYDLENLDLENFNLLLKLIGRQNIEKKGSNPGGDGALYKMSTLELDDNSAFTRKNFKNVAYWNPSIILDKNGKTDFEFKLPDNLTSWKILVVANTKTDLMGLGNKTITSSLPLQLNVNMPNQVSENDEFSAGFTVINKVDKKNKITVNIKATGPISSGDQTITKNIVLSNNGRESIFLKLKPTSFGEIKISASITDGENSDGLTHILTVNKARNIETAVNYGTSDKDKVTQNIQIPNNIYTDVGGLSTTLSPTMINSIEGSFKYMRDYPYNCWEQRLSKAAMFAYYKKLKPYLSDDFKWEEKENLTQKTLDNAYKNQAENGGMTYYVPSNMFVSPYLSVYTAMVFNWLEEEGYIVDKNVENKLHKYLSDLLKKEVQVEYYDPKIDYTVKAMTLYVLSRYDKVTDSDIMRYKDKFNDMSLTGKTYYLLAFEKIIGNEKDSKKMIDNILSFADFRSGRVYFEETLDTNFFVILDSSLRTNCVILNAMTELSQNEKYTKIIEDIPFKMIKGINDVKGSRYYFYNTQENVFCSKSFGNYSEKYENQTPNMKLNITMNEDNFGNTSFTSFKDKPYTSEYKFKNNDEGKAKKLTIEKDGTGRFYYANRITYASKNLPTDRINAGMDIRKEYSVKTLDGWKILNLGDSIKRGDLIRVDIYLSTPALRSFVVVEDSVLGGLEPVNRDLATSSIEDSDTGNEKDYPENSWFKQHSDWYEFSNSRWSFYHKELNFDKVRFYSEYLYTGNYHLAYTAQAIAEGIFKAIPVKAEEMYNPDIFGKGLFSELKIEENNVKIE